MTERRRERAAPRAESGDFAGLGFILAVYFGLLFCGVLAVVIARLVR